MKYEKSCGAVVFTRLEGEIKYVIIEMKNGVHGFPKGHVEASETEEETALREICEETGLKVRLLEGFKTSDVHPIPGIEGVMKQVIYFLAEYEDQTVKPQPEELRGAALVSYDMAKNLLEFESSRRVLKEANDFLKR